jgi:hypothetical protein
MPRTGISISNTRWGARGVPSPCTLGTARQDDRLGAERIQEGVIDTVEGMDFAIHPAFAEAAGDQLGDLTAKVDHQHAFMMGLNLGHEPSLR